MAEMRVKNARIDKCFRSINEMDCKLADTSLDAIVTTNSRGLVTSCSASACDLMGLLPGEGKGRHVSSFYAGGLAEARRVMQLLREGGRIRDYVTEIVTVTGFSTECRLIRSQSSVPGDHFGSRLEKLTGCWVS